MLIAIISDTHDNEPNVQKFLAWAKENEVSSVIHCGDVTNADTLREISEGFVGEVHFVSGNVYSDLDDLRALCSTFNNCFWHDQHGILEFDHLKIGFVHKPDEALSLAKLKSFNFVFYGHTHKPWIEEFATKREEGKLAGNVILANPGTLGGVFTPATFAVLNTDTGRLELKILEKI